jgi:hypothetical protein
MTAQVKTVLVAVATAALLPLTATQSVHAALSEGTASTIDRADMRDPFSGDCRRKKRKHLVHGYDVEGLDLRVPLRCGYHSNATDNGFGYRHIKAGHGFSLKSHRNIRRTLNYPTCTKHRKQRDIYIRRLTDWGKYYRVVDSFHFPEGYGGRLGIVTAYWFIQKPSPCGNDSVTIVDETTP